MLQMNNEIMINNGNLDILLSTILFLWTVQDAYSALSVFNILIIMN